MDARGKWWVLEVNDGHWRQVMIMATGGCHGKWCMMGFSCGCWRQVVVAELSDGHQEAIP